MTLPVPNHPSEPTVYAVRFGTLALREASLITDGLIETSGEEVARAWYTGLRSAASQLQTLPTRYPLLPDESKKIGVPTRRFLYRRSAGGVGHHLYYMVEEDSPDGPRVTVLHIRHAARKPLTAKEGREIKQGI